MNYTFLMLRGLSVVFASAALLSGIAAARAQGNTDPLLVSDPWAERASSEGGVGLERSSASNEPKHPWEPARNSWFDPPDRNWFSVASGLDSQRTLGSNWQRVQSGLEKSRPHSTNWERVGSGLERGKRVIVAPANVASGLDDSSELKSSSSQNDAASFRYEEIVNPWRNRAPQ